MAVVIIRGVGETYIQIWSEWRDVDVAGRPIQGSPGVIGQHLGGGIIARDRRKHQSTAGILWNNVGGEIWRAPIERIFEVKISHYLRIGPWDDAAREYPCARYCK